MTVTDASGMLFSWFSEHDSFEMDEDFQKVVLVTDHPSRDRSAFASALNGFEEGGLIKSSVIGDKEYWVINKHFDSYEQTLSVSSETCSNVATIINTFREEYGIEDQQCDPSDIQEKDLKNLLFICGKIVDEKEDEESA